VLASGGLIALGWLAAALGGGLLGSQGAAALAFALRLLAVVAGETLLWPRAVASVRARRIDMNVLMTVAVLGAVGIGDVTEAATVVFLFALGGWLEARALARTRSSIGELMRLAPDIARIRRDGAVVEVAPALVSVGETVVVRPGERLALDGEVTSGVSAVTEAAITGEPLPAAKSAGDAVYAGSLNGSGLLEVRVTSAAGDSTLARIVRLVEEAQASRSPSELLVDRFSRVYTPLAVGLAALAAVGPPLLGMALGPAALPFSAAWSVWLYRGLVVLVASCPCALVISTPVTFVSAIARAGREGVLVKGGAYLEMAASVGAVAFDKTGTLTLGRPQVIDVVGHAGRSADDVLALAASLEAASTHPLASAVLARAAEIGVQAVAVTGATDLPGRGIEGQVAGRALQLVSPTFAEEIASVPDDIAASIAAAEELGNTVVVLLDAGDVAGFIAVSDPVRPEAALVVRELRETHAVGRTVMLTGDNERTGAAVAAQVGVSGHMARLMPSDKVDAILRLRERYATVAMVGDGVNDAPALAAADIGIAMGAAGSDTALETADVALMSDDLSGITRFVSLGKRTLAIVRQNVAFSVAVKLVVVVAAVLGHATMWLAVFADTGVALLVIANGMRLLGGSRCSAPVAAVAK
jgi:Cd2+/Zn2+-exporting ATPase